MNAPLPHYQALEHTATRMAASARQGHWAEVQRLEGVARHQVQALKAAGPVQSFTPAERRVRLQALKAVLRLDAQVRNLAEPGWLKVEGWLNPSLNGQVGAYSADTQGKH